MSYNGPLFANERNGRRKKKSSFKLFLTLILCVLVLGAGALIYINSALSAVNKKSKQTVEVTIPRGSSTIAIAKLLEEKGVIKNDLIFSYYVRWKNEQGFQAGNYIFSPSMDIHQIIKSLQLGESVQKPKIKITIPEGSQLTEIAQFISLNTDYTKQEVLDKVSDEKFIKAMMKKYPVLLTDDIFAENVKYPLEGYFYPATYPFYTEKVQLEHILDKMLRKTNSVVEKHKRLMEEKKKTTHQLLTMASLIEEEATARTDREKIASVFYNRLDAGMPLQTDPTVLYALGKHKDRVYYKDLKIESPYNTYRVKGLPPGPIANAGEMSIVAALKPAQTDYLYFLATATGEVIFTKTLEDHNRQKATHITKQ